MVTTREIPRQEWTEFFDGFSRRHEGWLASVETLGPLGAQVEARDQPLTGITADRDGTNTISVLLGGKPGTDSGHIIEKPSRVLVEEDAGAVLALQIQTESGESTLVTFRAAVAPELVDGIASAD
jgi:hypothetical protein